FTLARALGGVAQAQAALRHVLIVWASSLRQHITQGFVQRVPSDPEGITLPNFRNCPGDSSLMVCPLVLVVMILVRLPRW
ncbi:hypothetical protein, partial [Acidovorax sp.]|uniref:hypothetical protein n=1 Tax=Acidovorax sp. TaxID=1872122 RepID=UPI0031D4478A